jgi:hypothetical protein
MQQLELKISGAKSTLVKEGIDSFADFLYLCCRNK